MSRVACRLGGLVATFVLIACSSSDGDSGGTGGSGSSSGSAGTGATSAAGAAHGGSSGAAGHSATAGAAQGGNTSTAGATNTAGSTATAGAAQGGSFTGGAGGAGGSATAGAPQGGSPAGGAGGTAGAAHGGTSGTGGSGGAAHGGSTGTGGSGGQAHGGTTGSGGSGGTAHGGSTSTGGGGAGGSAQGGSTGTDPVCSVAMPTGGSVKSGTDFGGTADGLAYALWTNGKGGNITVFDNAHAFAANWDQSANFLANIGLNFGTGKPYAQYGQIIAQFSEKKSGTDGGYSFIGVYGWTQNPCTEWYIVEDSYEPMPIMQGTLTATVDGGTYYMSTNQTTGSGGNACEAGHTGPWTQFWNVRSKARQCGTVTVSDHFDQWAKQGWTLGNLHYIHISLEVLGGTGEIDFPVANVTTAK